MKVINFFGGPSSGKSTSAAYIFSMLKQMNISCEYVNEYAKDCVYENRNIILQHDQLYILAKQNHKLKMIELSKQADFAIIDSPILLCNIYGKLNNEINENFEKYVLELFNSYENINIFMKRNSNFEQKGRVHNLKESKYVDQMILKYLNENNLNFFEVKDIKKFNINWIIGGMDGN